LGSRVSKRFGGRCWAQKSCKACCAAMSSMPVSSRSAA
jgi:hypothetical protein